LRRRVDVTPVTVLTNVQIIAGCVAMTPQGESIRRAAVPIQDCIVAV
jgi:hypothetical protein